MSTINWKQSNRILLNQFQRDINVLVNMNIGYVSVNKAQC